MFGSSAQPLSPSTARSGSPRPGTGKTLRGLPRPGEDGFGLIEAIVALFLLALIMIPVTRVALTTTAVSNGEHLRVEAADLASEELSSVTYAAEQSQQWTQGITTSKKSSGGDKFTVTVDVEPVNASELCQDGGTPQAWSAQATVSWGSLTPTAAVAAGEGVVQSTIIPAPSSTTANSTDSGEIAIPVNTSTLAQGVAGVAVTLTGSCEGSSCQPAPAGEPAFEESGDSGSTGCALFTGLPTGSSWTFTATVTNSNGYVTADEQSTASGAEPPEITTLTASPDSVTSVPADSSFQLAPGNSVLIGFQMTGFASTSGTIGSAPSAPVPPLPINVTSNLAGPSCPASAPCSLGDGESTFDGQQSALLFPPTVAASPGSYDYSGWAGNWIGANPAAQMYCPTATVADPCPAGATSFNSASGSVEFPVYPLALSITAPSTDAPIDLSASPVGTSLTLPLTAATVAAGATTETSTTGLPLGEYEITSSVALALPTYIWITPYGVCQYTTTSTPTSPCATPSVAPIAVAAS